MFCLGPIFQVGDRWNNRDSTVEIQAAGLNRSDLVKNIALATRLPERSRSGFSSSPIWRRLGWRCGKSTDPQRIYWYTWCTKKSYWCFLKKKNKGHKTTYKSCIAQHLGKRQIRRSGKALASTTNYWKWYTIINHPYIIRFYMDLSWSIWCNSSLNQQNIWWYSWSYYSSTLMWSIPTNRRWIVWISHLISKQQNKNKSYQIIATINQP